ncbi:MAG: dihydropteroate synthase [Flavobacteriaceae bacterium]
MEFQTKASIRCGGKLIALDKPLAMGILNITPDSFYDGGHFNEEVKALSQTEKMLSAGAKIIDVGAASSKPGSALIDPEEECQRLLPILEKLLQRFPAALFSIDTYNSATAKAAIEMGAHIINDISAGNIDSEMMAVVGHYKVPYIMMHMQGTPLNMQVNPQYNNIVEEIKLYFQHKIEQAYAAGITDLILDPGFGFGKKLEDNYEILRYFETLQTLGLPLLAGLSRKSMIYKTLNITADQALNGTTALNSIALLKGAKILRVHDVEAAVECIQLHESLN